MTPASCAPEGTAADFKIGVLERRRESVPAAALPGALPSPAPPRPPAPRAAAPLHAWSPPRFSRLAGMAPSRRRRREPARGGPRANQPGPVPGSLPSGTEAWGAGCGQRGLAPEPPRAPVRWPRGRRAGAGRGSEGKRRRGRDEASAGPRSARRPGRPPLPEARRPRAADLGRGESTTSPGARRGLGSRSRGGRRGPNEAAAPAGPAAPFVLRRLECRVKRRLEPRLPQRDGLLVSPTNRISQQERDFKLTIKITNCNSFSRPFAALKHTHKRVCVIGGWKGREEPRDPSPASRPESPGLGAGNRADAHCPPRH